MTSERTNLEHTTRIAQSYPGAFKEVAHCAALPSRGIYTVDSQATSPASMFFFAVTDVQRFRVGGTEDLAVSKATGVVTELGMIGEWYEQREVIVSVS